MARSADEGLGVGEEGLSLRGLSGAQVGPQRPADDAQVPSCSSKDGPAVPSSSVTDLGEQRGPSQLPLCRAQVPQGALRTQQEQDAPCSPETEGF